MHTDRTGPPLRDAVCPIAAPPAGTHRTRVVGLGSPLSVQITLTTPEVPALRAELSARLDQEQAPGLAANGCPSGLDAVQLALIEMLDQLQFPEGAAEVQVLWPTALAFPALRGAFDQALDALATVSTAGGDELSFGELDTALTTARSALATLAAFQAVDMGGLQDVPS